MNLQKAIELLRIEERAHFTIFEQDAKMAYHLAIEALTFIQLSRISSPSSVPALLHGET